ncbi:hypothetical protein BsWGS_13510 [Bradybaena similaris]
MAPRLLQSVVIILCLLDCALPLEILHTFRDLEDNSFQLMALDDTTGAVYVGATNRLHRLTSELNLLQSAATGPREDNPECPPPILPCEKPKAATDSLTKGLVIDHEHDSVILCTSLFHGSCQILKLSNITSVTSFAQKPSVPNDGSSCVMFLAQGPQNETSLYIGAEYSAVGDEAYRDLVPSISSRELKTLELAYRDKEGGTKMSIKQDLRSEFKVRFVAGFPYNGYVYFITVQPKGLKSKEKVTKIIRLCQGDRYFRSYIEIPLECQDASSAGMTVAQAASQMEDGRLVVSYSADSSSTPTSTSLCIYRMEDIDEIFVQTVQNCYNGQGKVGPDHYETIRTCMKTTQTLDLCASTPVSQAYPALEGQKGIEARSLLYIPDVKVTSIRAVKEGGQDIVHAGSAAGYFFKILVGTNQATKVTQISLDVSEPVLDIINSNIKERVYVLTSTKVYLINTNHCEGRQSCDKCVDGIDPLCGWCVMENSCTLKAPCSASAFTPSWLPATKNTCLNISDVDPSVISYQALQESASNDKLLKFSLESVLLTPSKDLDLGCMYKSGEMQHRTPASISNDRHITCPLPQVGKLSKIPQGKDHEQVSVHFHVKGKSIVTRSVSVYNCSAHTLCESCADSKFDCKWCYATGKCVEPRIGCVRQDGSGATWIGAAGSCPKIWSQSKDSGILVHSGQEKQIAVPVMNLLDGQTSNVKCAFTHSGKVEIVDATITSSSLTCNSLKFSFDGDSPYTIADFKVTWGPENLPLDNPSGIQVRIYKCQQMVSYCGQCLSMDEDYECGWCEGSCGNTTKCEGKCMLHKHCSNNWLDRTATCPNPQITRFSPTAGPIKGSTLVTVTGINLGKTYTDISAQVAGKPCNVKPDHYQPATRFVCEAGQVDVESSGVISVTVDGRFTAKSDSEFVFVDPVLTSLIPNAGPVSGGVVVTLIGDHLDSGSDVTVKMASGLCQVVKQNKTALECRIPALSSKTLSEKIEVNFGGYRKEVPEVFTYKPDPTISMIEPLKTILSGGTSITVRGDGLNLIQKPEFVTTYGGQFFREGCEVMSINIMECRVPAINSQNINITETSPLEVHYSFNMANITALRNISHNSAFGPLMYYPDPSVAYFEEDDRTKTFHESDFLSIQGRFRMVNVLMASVRVFVGDEPCSETSASDLAITCKPPTSTPKGTDASGKAAITVSIGNMRSIPGYLRYFLPSENSKPITLGVVLGVVLPILFIVVLLTICVLRRHRKHKPEQNFIPDVLKDYEGKKEGEDEEELIGMDNIPIKVDMNGGGQADRNSDSTPYINELLAKFEEPVLKQSMAAALISRRRLDIGDLIGKGYYGAVYKALYTHSDSDKQAEVAVKTLQARRSEAEALQQFLQDVALARDLSHPHLLRVVGAVISPSDDPIVVMPFMATEDLGSYIREPAKTLSLVDLLTYCHQIADAMAYLENLKIVHRNLAARNCIILEEDSKEPSIKLTDYVVTASLFPKEFYTGDDGVSELVRWMAPETVEDFIFSSHSDVWSYAVVMWEVLTRGVEPYPNTQAAVVISLVKDGKRLPKPKHCPESVYQIMLSCWAKSPEARPTFVQLLEQLRPYVATGDQNGGEKSQLLTSPVDVGGSDEYRLSG